MTLYKALSLSEELNCSVVHRTAGLKIRHTDGELDLLTLPSLGWELDDSPMPAEFECIFLGCDLMDSTSVGGKRGAVYSFEGSCINTIMPVGTRIKVKIEVL